MGEHDRALKFCPGSLGSSEKKVGNHCCLTKAEMIINLTLDFLGNLPAGRDVRDRVVARAGGFLESVQAQRDHKIEGFHLKYGEEKCLCRFSPDSFFFL